MTDSDSSPIPYAELASAFVSTAREVVARALGPTALPVRPTVCELGASGSRLVDPEQVASWFWAEVEFGNARLAGRFSYGDRDHSLDLELAIPAAPTRYALWEWARVLGRPELARAPESWVFQTERLVASLHGFGAALAPLHPLIVAADSHVIADLERHRADTAAEREETMRARHQERDEIRAAEAFRREAWAEAAELLAVHEIHLGPAQRRKLELARLRSRRGPG